MKPHARALPILAIVACFAGCGSNAGFLIRVVPSHQALTESVVASDPGWFISDKIAVIDLDGMIVNQRSGGLFGSGENPTALFIEKLATARRDENVRAVVVRINSPGGGVTASDMMYSELVKLRRDRKIPVVAVIEDMGASGGYYVACGADTIMAHPSSITGSVGVIVQTFSLAGTMAKLGITAKAVTSGPFKDMASPLKPLDKKDLAVLQGIVDEFYDRFVEVVATRAGSKLDAARARELADGRVYTGAQALEVGLVDKLGSVDDAVAEAKRLAGAKRVKVVMYHRPLGYRGTVYSKPPELPIQVSMVNISAESLLSLVRPQFLYLWTGHTQQPR